MITLLALALAGLVAWNLVEAGLWLAGSNQTARTVVYTVAAMNGLLLGWFVMEELGGFLAGLRRNRA